ncbi:unnamed protein product, partial [Brassica oleracea]
LLTFSSSLLSLSLLKVINYTGNGNHHHQLRRWWKRHEKPLKAME